MDHLTGKLFLSTIVLFGCLSGFAESDPLTGEKQRFAGAYEFVRMEAPEGVIRGQFGMLVIADGHFCHLRLTAEDAQQAHPPISACGTYRLEGDGQAIAKWKYSLLTGQEGAQSQFTFEVDQDVLTLIPALNYKLIYKRIESSESQ